MSYQKNRKWYQKKRYWLAGALFAGFILIGSGGNPQNSVQGANQSQSYQSAQYLNNVSTEVVPVSQETQTNAGLSNDNYYTNSAGNEVHSPAYSESIPVGASAKCRDGTYSFSQSRRGTCSHHGGVASWL